jgi:hypothetical protein
MTSGEGPCYTTGRLAPTCSGYHRGAGFVILDVVGTGQCLQAAQGLGARQAHGRVAGQQAQHNIAQLCGRADNRDHRKGGGGGGGGGGGWAGHGDKRNTRKISLRARVCVRLHTQARVREAAKCRGRGGSSHPPRQQGRRAHGTHHHHHHHAFRSCVLENAPAGYTLGRGAMASGPYACADTPRPSWGQVGNGCAPTTNAYRRTPADQAWRGEGGNGEGTQSLLICRHGEKRFRYTRAVHAGCPGEKVVRQAGSGHPGTAGQSDAHTHTHAHARTCMHTHAHARTHSHKTHTKHTRAHTQSTQRTPW